MKNLIINPLKRQEDAINNMLFSDYTINSDKKVTQLKHIKSELKLLVKELRNKKLIA